MSSRRFADRLRPLCAPMVFVSSLALGLSVLTLPSTAAVAHAPPGDAAAQSGPVEDSLRRPSIPAPRWTRPVARVDVEVGSATRREPGETRRVPVLVRLEAPHGAGERATALSEVGIELELPRNVSLARAYGYPVRITSSLLEVLAGSVAPAESRVVLLDLKVACTPGKPAPLGKATVSYRNLLRGGLEMIYDEDLGIACASAGDATLAGDRGHVDLYADLTRAAFSLQLILETWDSRLMDDVDAFFRHRAADARRRVAESGDDELRQLMSVIDEAEPRVRAGIANLAEQWNEERSDPRSEQRHRVRRLQHWETRRQLQMLRSDRR